jgi:hypothetical protein
LIVPVVPAAETLTDATLSPTPQLLESREMAATRSVAKTCLRFTVEILRENSIRMLSVPNFPSKRNVWLPAKRMCRDDGHVGVKREDVFA